MIIPNILQKMDLEDIRAAIAPRPLTIINPVDHLRTPLSPALAREEFAVVRKAFKAAHAANALKVKAGRP